MDKTVTKDTWYVATKDETVHYGFCPKGTQLSTGLTVQEFDNEANYLSKLDELGIEIEDESK